MTQPTYRIAFEQLAWEACGEGVRHKVHRHGEQVLRLVEYSSAMPPHWCERGHAGTILHGHLEIEFVSGTHFFTASDGVHIPAGPRHRHRARVLSDTVLALFVEPA